MYAKTIWTIFLFILNFIPVVFSVLLLQFFSLQSFLILQKQTYVGVVAHFNSGKV